MAVNTQTYTATLQNVPMQANHSGLSFARARFNHAVSNTDSSYLRLYLCKVPHGATIIDWKAVISATDGSQGVCTGAIGIYDASSVDATMTVTLRASEASISASAVYALGDDAGGVGLSAPEGFGYEISVSDNSIVDYKWIGLALTAMGSTSADSRTVYVDFLAIYTMDRQASAGKLDTVT